MTDYVEISGLLLRLTWGADDGEAEDVFLDVIGTDGSVMWSGSVMHGDLEGNRHGADLSQKQHAALSRTALSHTQQEPTLPPPPSHPLSALIALSPKKTSGAFYSEVTGTADSAVRNLVWKCDVQDPSAERIKVLLGKVPLQRCDEAKSRTMIMTLLSTLITERRDATRERDELAEKVQEVRSQKAAILGQLEQCVKAKEELEERLYVKFAQVLNSKKKKIRALAASIEKQATVQIGAKVFQYGVKGEEIPEGLRSAETSPKKVRLSPKKFGRKRSSSVSSLEAGEPGLLAQEKKRKTQDDDKEEDADSDAPKKPRNLLGAPEDPPPLIMKRNRRRAPLDEGEREGEVMESGGLVGLQHPLPSQSLAATATPVPAPTPTATRRLGSTTLKPGNEPLDPSPAKRPQKKQKSDPTYSVTDLINNI